MPCRRGLGAWRPAPLPPSPPPSFPGLRTLPATTGWIEAGWIAAGWIAAGWISAGWIQAGWIEAGWIAGWIEAGWMEASWIAVPPPPLPSPPPQPLLPPSPPPPAGGAVLQPPYIASFEMANLRSPSGWPDAAHAWPTYALHTASQPGLACDLHGLVYGAYMASCMGYVGSHMVQAREGPGNEPGPTERAWTERRSAERTRYNCGTIAE